MVSRKYFLARTACVLGGHPTNTRARCDVSILAASSDAFPDEILGETSDSCRSFTQRQMSNIQTESAKPTGTVSGRIARLRGLSVTQVVSIRSPHRHQTAIVKAALFHSPTDQIISDVVAPRVYCQLHLRSSQRFDSGSHAICFVVPSEWTKLNPQW